jgi:hypothetical protein
MNRQNWVYQVFFAWMLGILLFSCTRDVQYNTDPDFSLTFSQDTIIFDTVFVTIGSTTKRFTVHNTSNRDVKIDFVALAKAEQSAYKINIDGEGTDKVEDVVIGSQDSMFIFVEVRVDPTNQNNPMIITDSILFSINGRLQDVDLVAWGQDAHFIVGDANYGGFAYLGNHYGAFGKIVAHENEIVDWFDDKPYVVYGFAIVDSAATLNIHEGVNVYFHKNSGIWAYKGATVNVLGTQDSIVRFQGDRLETFYQNAPGQWFGVFLNESPYGHSFDCVWVKNSINGLHYEPQNLLNIMDNQPLVIKNTIVDNSSFTSLFAMSGRIFSVNSVYGKAAVYTSFLGLGGEYDFRHCTFDNHWSDGVRNDPSFVISDNMIVTNPDDGNSTVYTGDLSKAYFGNCIIYGSLEDEILLSQYEGKANQFSYLFDYSLLRTTMDVSDTEHYVGCVLNEDPWLADNEYFDYSIDTVVSSAIDRGSMEVINTSGLPLSEDIAGNLRISDEAPDLGAYEFIAE